MGIKHNVYHYYSGPLNRKYWGYVINDNTPNKVEEIGFQTEEAANEALAKVLTAAKYRLPETHNLPHAAEVFVDFDGTIYKGQLSEFVPDMAPPDPVAVQTLQELYNSGHKIYIYSCRSNKDIVGPYRQETLHGRMIEYLKKYDIPYTGIHYNKPHFHITIDDRAVGFPGDWNKIRSILGMPEAEKPQQSEE